VQHKTLYRFFNFQGTIFQIHPLYPFVNGSVIKPIVFNTPFQNQIIVNSPFLTFLQELRFETIHLSHQWHQVTRQEQERAVQYLYDCYQQETVDYPHQAPVFDDQAALWAALIVYYAAQAILNRKATLEELTGFFDSYKGRVSAGSVLSADLSLRFLPDLLDKLKSVNPDDGLILLLETQLAEWPYAAIGYDLATKPIDYWDNACLLQCYADRVLAHKDERLLQDSAVLRAVKASLGAHQQQLWPDLERLASSK
jgi:hypothetical protein